MCSYQVHTKEGNCKWLSMWSRVCNNKANYRTRIRLTYYLVQGLSFLIEILWRPRGPPKNNFLIMMKASVYSRGAVIWVSSTSFQKSNIAWPQQPPTEKIPNISEKLDFWWSIPQKGTSIGHFGARDDQTIMIRNFLEEIGL